MPNNYSSLGVAKRLLLGSERVRVSFDKIEVLDNVLLGDGGRRDIIVITQQEAEFGAIIPNSTRRVMFGGQDIR